MLAANPRNGAQCLRAQRSSSRLAFGGRLAPRVQQRQRVATQAAATGFAIEELRHITEDGWGLEVLASRPQGKALDAPPILFVHGSYHAAWCWSEKFMPWFSSRGYTCYALSLRAQGNSDCVSNDKDSAIMVAGTLASHASDLADFVQHVFVDAGRPAPVIAAHSFGGLILQKYIQGIAQPGSSVAPTEASKPGNFPQLSGAAFLACVPPTGNKDMIVRFLLKDPWLSVKVTWGFVAKSFAKSVDACRELYFSDDIPRPELEKYQKLLASCSPVRLIDLNDVNRSVPLPPPPPHAPPAFVLGGETDKVVDTEAIRELATAYKVPPVILPAIAHDVMLDTRWESAAQSLESWVSQLKAK